MKCVVKLFLRPICKLQTVAFNGLHLAFKAMVSGDLNTRFANHFWPGWFGTMPAKKSIMSRKRFISLQEAGLIFNVGYHFQRA